MIYKESSGYRYTLRGTLRSILMDIALVTIYGVLLIINFIRRLKNGSKHEY